MNLPRLEEISARLKAATPGPWKPTSDLPSWAVASESVMTDVVATVNRAYRVPHRRNLGCRLEDAEFIAHAPEDISYLIAALKEALSALEKVSFGDLPNNVFADDVLQKIKKMGGGVRC